MNVLHFSYHHDYKLPMVFTTFPSLSLARSLTHSLRMREAIDSAMTIVGAAVFPLVM
jgi:hypothetical protein